MNVPSTAPRTIGIIGAAIAGPALALQILSHPVLRKSWRPILFDRANDPRQAVKGTEAHTGGAAVGLFANGIYPLYQLGLKEVFDRHSIQTPVASFWTASAAASNDQKLRHLGSMHGSGWADDLQTSLSIIERQELQSLLVTEVEQRGGRVVWNHKLDALKRSSDHKTQAIFDNAVYDLDLVVGADGAFSTVRKHILNEVNARIAQDRWMPDHCGMTGIYSISSGMPVIVNGSRPGAYSETHGIWLSPGLLSSSPLPNGRMRWDVLFPEPKPIKRHQAETSERSRPVSTSWKSKIISNHYSHEHTASMLQKMSSLPNPVTGTFGRLIEASDRIIHTPLLQKVWNPEEIQRQNIVLVGDAARVLLPSSGQGTSFAIEDATVLANMLLKYPPTKPGDCSKALAEYAKERVPRSKKMAKMASFGGLIGLGETWYWRLLRDSSAWLFSFKKDRTSHQNPTNEWPFNARYSVESDAGPNDQTIS